MKKIVPLLLLLLLVVGCKKKETPPELSFPITETAATVADVPLIINSYGTFSAPNTVNLNPQVSGEIIQVPFEQGSFVQKGDLLVAIDPSPFLATLLGARAKLLGDEANLHYTKEAYESYSQLAAEDFISPLDLANYYKSWKMSEASVLSDVANVENAKINLGYTQITSPIDGVIGFINNQTGNIANPSESIVSITQVKPLYITFSLSEQDLWLLRDAQKNDTVSIEALFLEKGRNPVIGTLLAIDNSVDTSTGTIMLKASFDNDLIDVWPGEFARLNITVKTLPSSIVIDKNAILYGQNGAFVYIINADRTVSVRNLKLGPSFGEKNVVTEGLQNGDHVVLDGQLNLYQGAKVKIKQ